MGLYIAIGLLAALLVIAIIIIADFVVHKRRTTRPAQKQNENTHSENVNPAFNNDAMKDFKEGDQYETLDATRPVTPGYEVFTVQN